MDKSCGVCVEDDTDDDDDVVAVSESTSQGTCHLVLYIYMNCSC